MVSSKGHVEIFSGCYRDHAIRSKPSRMYASPMPWEVSLKAQVTLLKQIWPRMLWEIWAGGWYGDLGFRV